MSLLLIFIYLFSTQNNYLSHSLFLRFHFADGAVWFLFSWLFRKQFYYVVHEFNLHIIGYVDKHGYKGSCCGGNQLLTTSGFSFIYSLSFSRSCQVNYFNFPTTKWWCERVSDLKVFSVLLRNRYKDIEKKI
jgi:hypothetical protein